MIAGTVERLALARFAVGGAGKLRIHVTRSCGSRNQENVMHSLASRVFALSWGLVLVATAASAQVESLPPAGLAQIDAYTAEKLARTPTEAKLSSQLLHAMRALAGQPPVPGLSGPIPGVQQFIATRVAADATVQVTIQGDINSGLLAAIAAAGGTQIDPYPQYSRVTARLPLNSLLAVAARGDVRAIRPLDQPQTNRYFPSNDELRTKRAAAIAQGIPNAPIANQGGGTSEGVHAHGADLAVASGIDGTGVKICVLSDGVDSLATLQGAGELPAVVDVVAGQAGSGDEGTAMLQIVHDMAPNAALGFATAFTSDVSFAANIVTLRNPPHNCDIIVDDVTYFEEGAFQDGPIARAVNTVTTSGALYFSSAANSGNLTHLVLAGTWEGDFVNGGAAGRLTRGGTLHSFGATTYDTLTTAGSVVILEWSDSLGASDNDYDLYIFDPTGTTVLTSSTDTQNGTQDPVEGVQCDSSVCPTDARVVVVLFSGSKRALRVDTERGTMTIVTDGNTFGHNAAASAFTAAATDVANAGGGQYTGGAADPTEDYSSDGPRKIFYNPNGTTITPGNVLFGTNGGTTLAKVDLTASDCVSSFVIGFTPFCGTSSAAPHSAAIAGLIKSAKLTATNAQITTALENSALDIEASGRDRDSGVGIVMAPAGVRAVLNTLVVGTSFTPSLIAVGGTSVLTITLQNTNAVALKAVAFTDTYPTHLVNFSSPGITGTGCTGSLAATSGSSTFALTSGVVPPGVTCAYKVTVTSGTAGTYNNATGTVTTPIALNSATVSAALTVGTAPAITSANATSFTYGAFGTFTVTTSGTPVPSLGETGTLPGGVGFVDNGNGTATLSGTPTVAGKYLLTITANNGFAPNGTQTFTLTVNATVPSAPTIGTATAGNAQATVPFSAPASNGGSAITGYTAISNPAGGVDSNAGTTGTSHVVTGLTNGTPYTFTVTAKNVIGTGPASAASNSVTPATVPGAPTIGHATAGNALATVTFSAPASNGGSAITGYTAISNPAGGVDSNAGSTSTSHVVTGLTNGTSYTFTVTAKNAIGTSAPSAASNSVTPSTSTTEPCGTGSYPFPYTDVASVTDPFCPGIMEAYVTGVSKGTAPTTFSPDDDVIRLQMTTFLQRALDQGLTRASPRAAFNQWAAPQGIAAMQTVAVGGTPQSCAADGEDIWTSTTGQVVQVQASTGKILGTWTGASNSFGMVVAAGKVFVAGSPDKLYAIDPTTSPGAVTQVASPGGANSFGIAFDGTNLWTANTGAPGSVSIITPQATTPYPVTTVTTGFASPTGVLYDGAHIWVTDTGAGTLLKLDPAGAILQTVTVGTAPLFPAFDGANIWVPNSGSSTITVVQASSGTVVATINADANNLLNAPVAASFDGERVLVSNATSVTVFKAADLSVIANVPTGAGSTPYGVCSDGIHFWVPLQGNGNLLRF